MPRGAWAVVVYWFGFVVLLIWALAHDLHQFGPVVADKSGAIGEAGTEAKCDQCEKPKGVADDPVALATLIVAAATGALAVSTFGLWRVTRRSVIVAERALTELERPFLLPSYQPGLFEARRNQRQRIFIRYEICNYGRTPALITHMFCYCEMRTDAPQAAPKDWFAEIPTRVMAPGEKIEREHIELPRASYREIDMPTEPDRVILSIDVPSGNGIYFYYGFRYRDIFGKTHETTRFWRYRMLTFDPFGGDEYNRTT